MIKGKMDKKKISKYQTILSELKEKIVSDIKQIAEHASPSERSDSGDVSGHVMHLADVATDMYDREFSLGLASNDRELLQKIEKALKRIDAGTFGLCDQCQGSISQARLEALPYVDLCLKCQEKLEKK
ncbi:MAG: TraR/DksA C4-type zinc finger protein [Candidatus Omnitrophica bacterium]|nr:TraR/DksA C4-type zinc finger protein [Candidatus Omnitrophota bacterium]